jgi:uncharacterized protein (DUF58 family)
VLEFFGAYSGVPWLFLVSAWLIAVIPIAYAYATWNRRGLDLHLKVLRSRPSNGSPVEWLPEQYMQTAPLPAPIFESDGVELEVGLTSKGAASRGPAWISGTIASTVVTIGTGLVTAKGWRRLVLARGVRRGPLTATSWTVGAGDALGFFRHQRINPDAEVGLVLPRFTSLASDQQVRELEASAAAPRAGSGTELFGVREYRSGDSLRRIHWRSSARRGELVVREYEPPGVQTLGIFVDPSPASVEVADQIARIAACEVWDCIRQGGRAVLWAPGLEPSQPSESRSLWALLEWLARYPDPTVASTDLPISGDVIGVTAGDARVIEAIETAKSRGARVRVWVVGEAQPDIDAPILRVESGQPA